MLNHLTCWDLSFPYLERLFLEQGGILYLHWGQKALSGVWRAVWGGKEPQEVHKTFSFSIWNWARIDLFYRMDPLPCQTSCKGFFITSRPRFQWILRPLSLCILFLSRKVTFFPIYTLLCFLPGEFCPGGRLLIYINVSGEDFDTYKDFSSWRLAQCVGVFRQSPSRQLKICMPVTRSRFFKLRKHADYYRPPSTGMPQCQHHLVKLVCFPEAPPKVPSVCKESWTNRGKLIKGLPTLGFLGCHRKALGVWVERNTLSKGTLLWSICQPNSSSCFGGFIYSLTWRSCSD